MHSLFSSRALPGHDCFWTTLELGAVNRKGSAYPEELELSCVRKEQAHFIQPDALGFLFLLDPHVLRVPVADLAVWIEVELIASWNLETRTTWLNPSASSEQ